jgi:hypothetical protein
MVKAMARSPPFRPVNMGRGRAARLGLGSRFGMHRYHFEPLSAFFRSWASATAAARLVAAPLTLTTCNPTSFHLLFYTHATS